MAAPQNIIAVIFDFDDTLTDDSTTKLLEAHGIDATDFWQNKMRQLTQSGWDSPLAYLTMMLDYVGVGKPFGKLTNEALTQFGSTLSFYQGIPQLFTDLQVIANTHTLSHPAVEFYIVSGGLENVIRGSSIAKHFSGIWGCRFHEKDGQVQHIANSITFTEKTKFLFAINKGISDEESRNNPYAVNEFVKDEDRRVPFSNMIYIGDGLTDVPCFSLLGKQGGISFGIVDPKKKNAPKKTWEQLVIPKRVTNACAPEYGPEDVLGAFLRAAVNNLCSEMDLTTQTALQSHRRRR